MKAIERLRKLRPLRFPKRVTVASAHAFFKVVERRLSVAEDAVVDLAQLNVELMKAANHSRRELFRRRRENCQLRRKTP